MRIAVIGSGVAGLVAVHHLRRSHEVQLFEAEARPGGHAHTHRLELPDATIDVDTGFLVYNDRTYPIFSALLEELGIATRSSDMSFGVTDERTGVEWRGTSINTVFAQRRNLLRPEFLGMLRDIRRFHRVARDVVRSDADVSVTLQDVIDQYRFSRAFKEWYLVPLGSSIWSADPRHVTSTPAVTALRFFDRHGLLDLGRHPEWRTVVGGAARYVEAILAPLRAAGRLHLASPVRSIEREDDYVEVRTDQRSERFDHVVIATHSDQALAMLSDADLFEKEMLSAIRYQANRATLHTDASLMPTNRRAWASWNFHRFEVEREEATLTYHLNTLQGLATKTPLFVTLNCDDRVAEGHVIEKMDYHHPILDEGALRAQARWSELQGRRRTWFCGAYWGYGFHEDGARSAVDVCHGLGVRP